MDRRLPPLEVRQLSLRYGERLILRDLSFSVGSRAIFVVMGGSGCGKSTVLKSLIGLKEPATGYVLYGDVNLWSADSALRDRLLRRSGVLYQSGALWSSLTVGENVALPLQTLTSLNPGQVRDLVELKLALVGLGGLQDYYPHELSGGMTKRAGLARALVLDPEILFFDEPTAGLDPMTARRFDDLILTLRDTTGVAAVVVTHELASIFAIADDAVFLDGETKTISARGAPKRMLAESKDPKVLNFLTRGQAAAPANGS
jgi:phospholipid/cholesterol/gamma-HCH transport system ATP-binding protein